MMEFLRETQFPSADKKVSDERSADAAEKDKDVEKAEEMLRRARIQANVDALRLKESKRRVAAAAVEEATAATVQSSDQTQVMPLFNDGAYTRDTIPQC